MKLSTQGVAVAAALGILLTTFQARASGSEHREHGAHEHGHGIVNIVVEGSELAIELEVPGVNVVGFEHEPGNDAQRHAVAEAIALFKRGEMLFVTPQAAGCQLREAEVTLAGEQHHEGEDHSGQDPGTEQDQPSGQAHEEQAAHSELHGEYRFHCQTPPGLDRIELKLFGHLKDLDDIDVQIVTQTLQKAAELGPDHTVIRLTGD